MIKMYTDIIHTMPEDELTGPSSEFHPCSESTLCHLFSTIVNSQVARWLANTGVVSRFGDEVPVPMLKIAHFLTVPVTKQTMRDCNVHFGNDLSTISFKYAKNHSASVYDHITLKTPVLVRSPKLSNVERG